MRKTVSRLSFLAIPLLLVACSPEAEEGGAADDAAAVEDEDGEPYDEATLDLQATGLIVPAQNGFEQLAVPFGSMRAATEATLANVLGDVSERGENAECGEGPMQTTSYRGIVLYFQDDEFVGYTAREPYVPEITRADMLADPAVTRIEDSTLGDEFMIGQESTDAISGIFAGDGTDEDAPVEVLWAGMTCNFR